MTKQRILRAAVSGAALWLTGATGAAEAASGAKGKAAEVPASPARPRTLDDALLELNTEVPDFGGMYYDEKGRLVVRLVHASAAPAARLAIAAMFGPEKIPAEGLVTEPATRTFVDGSRAPTEFDGRVENSTGVAGGRTPPAQ